MANRAWTRWILALLGVACAGCFVLLGTLSFGLVSGEEFGPDTFERRSYWYYELPLVRVKITPVVRDVQRHQLETLLVTKKYVIPQSPPKRWDLVASQRGGQDWRRGDAQILCSYLDAWDPDNNMTSYWETWTTDHPALAKILWPEIATLARRELYFLIPPLLEKSLEHEKPQPLQDDLNRLLANSYDMLAGAELELGHVETAVQFYSDALQRQPGRTSSLQGRAACYDELGKTRRSRTGSSGGSPTGRRGIATVRW